MVRIAKYFKNVVDFLFSMDIMVAWLDHGFIELIIYNYNNNHIDGAVVILSFFVFPDAFEYTE